MITDQYTVRVKRSHCLTGILVGAVLLFLGLDLRFLHTIPGSRITSEPGQWIAFAIFAGCGILFLRGSIQQLFRPATVLHADRRGLTLFSGGSSKVWDQKTRSWTTVRAKGDSKTIPWSHVHSIGEGIVLEESPTQWQHCVGFGDDSGSMTLGRHRMYEKPCLQILFPPEVKVQGFQMGSASRAWNGYTKEDIAALSPEERTCLQPEDVHSGLVLKKEYLTDSLDNTIHILQSMQRTEV